MDMRRTLAFFAALCLFPACTIHEDREGCPCRLTIFAFRSNSGTPHRELRLLLNADTKLIDEDIKVSDENTKVYYLVPKSIVEVFSISGLDRSSIKDGTVVIPRGSQSDSIFAYSNVVDARGETAADTLRLHKQFTTLEIEVEGDILTDGLQLRLSGNACGFRELGLLAVEGRFEAELERVRDNVFRARIPRQCDNALTLSVHRGKDLLREYEVGRLLSEVGMDWTKPSLDDVCLSVDLSKTTISIEISDWDTGLTTETVI